MCFLLKSVANEAWWTGGIGEDSPSGSTFVWNSDRYTAVKNVTQNGWCPGQPNSVANGGNCIMLLLNSWSYCEIGAVLDDYPCTTLLCFICEYELTNIGY